MQWKTILEKTNPQVSSNYSNALKEIAMIYFFSVNDHLELHINKQIKLMRKAIV